MSNKFIKTFVLFTVLSCPLFIFAKSSKIKSFNKTKHSGYQNELLVIGALKNLYAAQANYFSTVGNRKFGNLAQLREANLIDEILASSVKFGYIFSVQASTDTFNPSFIVTAKPSVYRKNGKRSFHFNARCEIRGADKNGADADINDALIETCVPTLAYENEPTIIQAIRTLISAEETYKSTVGNGNYGLFSQLYSAGLIGSELAFGFYHNYNLQITITSRIPTTPEIPATFRINSAPYPYGIVGFRSFFTNTTQIIRGADHQGQNGNENDPPIEDPTFNFLEINNLRIE